MEPLGAAYSRGIENKLAARGRSRIVRSPHTTKGVLPR